METNQTVSCSFDDMLFENRNKKYGAYSLRKQYSNNLIKAVVIAISFVLLAMCVPLILNYFNIGKNLEEKKPFDDSHTFDPSVFNTPLHSPKPVPTPSHIVPPAKTVNQNVFKIVTTITPVTNSPEITTPNTGDNSHGTESPYTGPVTGGTTTGETPAPPVVTVPLEPVRVPEKMPSFPGGIENLYKFIRENLKYPKIAVENDIKGIVYVSFIVDVDGSIKKVEVLHGIGAGCDEEAIRVIKSMPAWEPGRNNGIAVPVLYNFPIKFVLK